jgi:hypothetical protein
VHVVPVVNDDSGAAAAAAASGRRTRIIMILMPQGWREAIWRVREKSAFSVSDDTKIDE